MSTSQGSVAEANEEEELEGRKFRSPSRVLARSFRIGRDNWRAKLRCATLCKVGTRPIPKPFIAASVIFIEGVEFT